MATVLPNATAPPAANTSKRDALIELEASAQRRWEAEKLFETDSPYTDSENPQQIPTEEFSKAAEKLRESQPKWFGTFPYPVSWR